MFSKQFSVRLNQELDKIDVPKPSDERIEVFAKLLHIPRFKAETILSGHIPADPTLMTRIAEELEVDEDWLRGKEA